MTSKKLVLSATGVKQFLDCSWLYYQTRILKVPDHTHPKTLLGTLAHAILEALCSPRHHKHYEAVLHHQSVYGSPAIARMVKMFRKANPDVTDEIMADLDKLVFVALNHDFMCKGTKKVLPPEHPFEIDFGDFAIKGFMDRVLIYDNIAVIRDYKTQSKRFTDEQLQENLQAFFYQTAIKHQFGLPSSVEFLLLRFPANRKDPERYIQKVAPLTEDQMEGFGFCLSFAHEQIQALTEKTSTCNMKSLKDNGFCLRVCSLKDPADYWVLLEGDKILKSTRLPKWDLQNPDPDGWAANKLKPKEGQRVEKRRYGGCFSFWGANEQRRAFQ